MVTYDFIGAVAPGQLGIAQATLPDPTGNQVLIKVEYSTLGPFDLYGLDRQFYVPSYPYTFGVNAAGTVAALGSDVTDLGVGNRIVAFPLPPGPKGAQPYTLQDRSVIAKIPDSISLEHAVSFPDNYVTAFYTLFNQLGLPLPTEWPAKDTPRTSRPILIYGPGATSGQYAIQLLKLAGYTNVVAVASKHHEQYLKSLGAIAVLDYKSASFAEDAEKAAGVKLELVMDCISTTHTFELIANVVRPGASIAWLAPFKAGSGSLAASDGELLPEIPKETQDIFPEGVKFICVRTFLYQQDERLKNTVMPTVLPKLRLMSTSKVKSTVETLTANQQPTIVDSSSRCLPIPEPTANQVLIKVEYGSITPLDLYNLDRQFHVQSYPHVFGLNAAGVVEKLGSGVTDLKIGDKVAALTMPSGGSSGLQPHVVQTCSAVAKIPDSVPLEKAVSCVA